ncbi:MAG: ABC transporter permease [Candidatus Ratteibacteria bacterium]|nr:ABC transporter permease [Candidatus Ratteibacteria bacterium]
MKQKFELSLTLAKAEFIERNEGSYLGLLWYLLNPLLLFLLLLMVFSDRVGSKIQDYPFYLLLGIIMFNFFQHATTDATEVIRKDRILIKSINFPKECLIGATVLKSLFSHMFEIIILIGFLIFFKISPWNIIIYPAILFLLSIFVFGISLILSSLTIYFVDLNNMWMFIARLIWLGTPIFYAIEGQERLLFINLFNPMYYFITIARETIIYAKIPQLWLIFGAIGYSFAFLFVGLLIFNKLKTKFAEMM